jgi:hypothetical protein
VGHHALHKYLKRDVTICTIYAKAVTGVVLNLNCRSGHESALLRTCFEKECLLPMWSKAEQTVVRRRSFTHIYNVDTWTIDHYIGCMYKSGALSSYQW